MNTPLLLLHGALGSKIQLLQLQQILSKTREVHILDFEGHGDSLGKLDFSISAFRENVVSYLQESNIKKVDVFGYSLGGYVALDAAYHYPSLFRNIMTLGTKFSWTPDFAAHEIKMLNAEKIQEKVPAFAQRLQDLHGIERWKDVVAKTASFMENLGAHPTLTKTEFAHISNRVLICLGEMDKMVTKEESVEVARQLQNGSFRMIDTFKHPIESVPTAELAHIINEFLKEDI